MGRELAKLSQICPLNTAIPIIKQQINIRLTTLGRRTSRSVQSIDVLKAYETLNPPHKHSNSKLISVLIPSKSPTELPTIQSAHDMDDIIYSDPPATSSALVLSSSTSRTRPQRCHCSEHFKAHLASISSQTESSACLKLF